MSINDLDESPATEITLSKDMREWIESVRFSEVPYMIYEEDFPEKAKGNSPVKYMMVFAPESTDRHIDKLVVEFDDKGVWTYTWIDSSDSSVWMPRKDAGFTIEETAFIILLQLEESNRSRSWPYYRAQKNGWSFPQSTEDMKNRMKRIQRAKIMNQIEMSAYAVLAEEHKEKFTELVEAASVEKALASDWFRE